MKYRSVDAPGEASHTNLRPGDLSRNYIGDNPPAPIRRSLEEGSYDPNTPELSLIWKERWQIVRQVIGNSTKYRQYIDWLLDHFSGYSFEEIGNRYSVTRQVAFFKVNGMLDLLKSNLKGHPF